MWHKLFNICVLLGVIGVHEVCGLAYLTEQPQYLQPCRISEPGCPECLRSNKQELVNLFTSGNPKIVQKFGSFDPFRYSKKDFSSKDLKITLTNIVLTGFKNTIIKEDRVNPADFSMHTEILVPHLRLEANYELDGKVQKIHMTGDGEMYLEIDNLNLVIDSPTRLYEKDGFTFFKVTHVGVDLDVQRIRSNFENLSISKSKSRMQTILLNNIINSKWKELIPMIIPTLERVALTLEQRCYSYVPANFIIEDIPTSDQ